VGQKSRRRASLRPAEAYNRSAARVAPETPGFRTCLPGCRVLQTGCAKQVLPHARQRARAAARRQSASCAMAWITVGPPNPFDRPPRPEDDPGWVVRQSIAMQIDREAAELPEKVLERLRNYRVLETLDRIRETRQPDDMLAVLHEIIDRLCSAIVANHCLPEPSPWVESELQRFFRFAAEEAKIVPPALPSSPSSAEPVVAPKPEKAKVKTKQLRTEVATKECQSKSATRRRAAIALHKEGKTPKEIGGELGISPITIRGYIRDRERDTKTLISSKAARPGKR
jgi:Homeodomain-like domain